MKISLVQYSPRWENKSWNMKKIISFLSKAKAIGDLVVFPEMTLTGFTMNATEMAEKTIGESVAFFSIIAESYEVEIIFGLIEKGKRGCYNSLIHLDKQGIVKAKYRKIHPFSYSTEDKFYNAGEKIVIANSNGWKVGLSICYDLRFPELYRLYSKKKVDLIINIANWPDTRIEHWRTLLKVRAIENQCYIAGVNRIGDDKKLHYNGYSSIYDPMGKEIIFLKDKEVIRTVEVDKNYVKEVRQRLPFLNDMILI
jgi:predicted amidohydrolase